MADLQQVTRLVGAYEIVESGSIITGRAQPFTVNIGGLIFSFRAVHDRKIEPITIEEKSTQNLGIKINTWLGGDLTFKFKVGTFQGNDLHLAIHLDTHNNYDIWIYTFTKEESSK